MNKDPFSDTAPSTHDDEIDSLLKRLAATDMRDELPTGPEPSLDSEILEHPYERIKAELRTEMTFFLQRRLREMETLVQTAETRVTKRINRLYLKLIRPRIDRLGSEVKKLRHAIEQPQSDMQLLQNELQTLQQQLVNLDKNQHGLLLEHIDHLAAHVNELIDKNTAQNLRAIKRVDAELDTLRTELRVNPKPEHFIQDSPPTSGTSPLKPVVLPPRKKIVQSRGQSTNVAKARPLLRNQSPFVQNLLINKATENMEKTYSPPQIEQHWYEIWEQRGYFAPSGEGEPYCIMIPPPNVTGSLHMGHAFQDTLMDTLARYHRMRGRNVLWQPGTDHAGIATQMVVERQLAAKGKSRHDLGREAFIKQIWRWKEESGGTITRQLRRLGASLDWSRERFTMDVGLSKAVREVFVRLYDEGLIYRGKRLVNWDPVLQTAVSDLEVVSQEEDGFLWHIQYPLADKSATLTVATTRPETMLGDAAVAVHPEDARYRHLIGKFVELPLTGRQIPIIADDYVDPTFGTGCLKITPGHDFNDYQVWLRHRETNALRTLPHGGLISIFTADAKLKHSPSDDSSLGQSADAAKHDVATVDLIPVAYRGLDRFAARKQLLADLESNGFLLLTQPHKLMVPRGDRSHAVIEPLLTDQWFVRVAPLAQPAIDAVENGDVRFVPDNWKNTYFEWMRNIEDWCISRQIWWGHRVPAWYDPQGNIYVGRSEAEVRKKHSLNSELELTQDPDVLDTWFSSALWPFSTLGWPETTPDLKAFYPTSVLVTGFDIIFFWVARMIMMGTKFMGEVPFHEVYIHGLVRDAEGHKMSKSKGNVLDPIDLIDGIDLETLVTKRSAGLMQPEMAKKVETQTRKQFPDGIPAFGTDALRFTFAALASTGRDIRFETARIEGYRNFCNKLWNAARYVLMFAAPDASSSIGVEINTAKLTLADRWIISKLQIAEQEIATAIETYRFDFAAQAIYEFTWNEYCDWYVELSKATLSAPDADPEEQHATRSTLIRVLETLLRLAHPIIPFITEEIWQRVAPLAEKQGETIMLQPYPVAQPEKIDAAAVQDMEWVKAVILGIRKIRGEMNIAPSKALPVLLQGGSMQDRARTQAHYIYLKALARLDTITWLFDKEVAPESATALVGEMKVFIPMADVIDKQAELLRLDREIQKIRKDLAKSEVKLSNPDYVERAPRDVVDKERARINELRSAIKQLDEQLARIEVL